MSAKRITETAKAIYLLEYARGASHNEAAKAAGASRRSFYDARARDPDFGRACRAVYEANMASEYGTRMELVDALRELSSYLAYAADQLEQSSFTWFKLREGLIGALEELDRRGLDAPAPPDTSPTGIVRALNSGSAALPPGERDGD